MVPSLLPPGLDPATGLASWIVSGRYPGDRVVEWEDLLKDPRRATLACRTARSGGQSRVLP